MSDLFAHFCTYKCVVLATSKCVDNCLLLRINLFHDIMPAMGLQNRQLSPKSKLS